MMRQKIGRIVGALFGVLGLNVALVVAQGPILNPACECWPTWWLCLVWVCDYAEQAARFVVLR